MRVFIAGATSTGPCVREHRLGEDIVGEAVRQARERVRRQRRDDEEIPPPEMRIGIVARGRRASALNVSGATNRSALAVSTGSTSCPARTSRRTSVQAL